jgi:CHAT domain-containing protein
LKRLKLLAGCLFLFSFSGGALKSPPKRVPVRKDSEPAAKLHAANARGGELYRAGKFREASEIYQSVFAEAQSLSLPDLAARALGNLGSIAFARHQYKKALEIFQQARRLSESAGDTSAVAGWDANVASLYFEMGDVDSAAEWASRSLERMRGPDLTEHLPRLQIELASLRALQGRMPEARKLFAQGIEGADRMGDVSLYAIGWNHLGSLLLERGDLPGAEPALLEAYRTCKLHHLALDFSLLWLGRLRLAQGDLASASALLDRAVEVTAESQGTVPTWELYYYRSLVRLAQARPADALADLRIARRLGRAWRWSAPGNETVQIGAEGWLDQVYSALVEAGNRLYLETHEPALKGETFTANEENRAVALRTLWERQEAGRESELPDAYWQALRRLQRAEVAAIREGNTADLAAARAEVIRTETSLGGDFQPLPEDLPEVARRKLDAATALLSFHLGQSVSWLWAVDRRGLDVYALPGRAALETQARAVAAAIREDRPDAAALSASFYQTIFGPVAQRFRNAPHWLLALDGALFEAPITALVEEAMPDGAPAYVAMRHRVELIPGVGYWLEAGQQPEAPLSALFVGVGDPIYNRADARNTDAPSGSSSSLILPRLVGSGTEVEACARAWDGQSVLLRGKDASREKLAEQLRQNPAVVHLATHYLESAGRPRYSLIALSLAPTGETQVLSPLEVSGWRIHAGLVVLSGCHSAAGAALPGEGVMGLTRAWLAAGARSVVGSLWDTPDDEGALFGEFYRYLRVTRQLNAGAALQAAQMAMIDSGGRLSRPSYWGAYFAVASRRAVVIPGGETFRMARGGE